MKVYVVGQYDGRVNVFYKKKDAIKFMTDAGFRRTKRDSNIFTLEDDLDSISEYECVLNECEVK